MAARAPRLTWGGKVILTLSHAAARYSQSKDAVRVTLARRKVKPIDPPPIDERTPTWYQADLDPIMRPKVGGAKG